jgi:hypothetical protein
MKLLTVALVTVIVLSLASVAATSQSKASLGGRVQALEEQVARLETMRWTQQHATNVVGQRVWDRISSCRTPKSVGPCSSLDPVLYAFHGQNVPDPVTHRLYREGYWTAQPGADGNSWQVTATISIDGASYGPFIWYVWSSNSLVWAANYYADMGYGKR